MTKNIPLTLTKEEISTDLEQIGIVRVRRIGGDQETRQYCRRNLGTEDLAYGGTRTHDLVVESPVP